MKRLNTFFDAVLWALFIDYLPTLVVVALLVLLVVCALFGVGPEA